MGCGWGCIEEVLAVGSAGGFVGVDARAATSMVVVPSAAFVSTIAVAHCAVIAVGLRVGLNLVARDVGRD